MASTKSPEPKEAGECKENARAASSVRKKKKHQEGLEFVAPDGGWGWVIVVAGGMSNFSTVPLIQNFGLIYKQKFEEWGINQAEYSFMRNLEFTISSFAGLISGALLRKYGFRRMSFIGGVFTVLSVLITSQVTTITSFIIFYAVIGGIALGINLPSNALAINTYFKKRRGIATGFTWTLTGLSPVIMPQLISLLMEYTDVHGTVLILAGIALHSLPFALLLQPAHWHGRWVEPEANDAEKGETKKTEEQEAFLEVKNDEECPHSKCKYASLKGGQVEGDEEDFIVDTQSTLGLDMAGPISRHSSRWSLGSGGSRRSLAGRVCEECKSKGEGKSPVVLAPADAKESEGAEKKGEKEESKPHGKPIWKRMLSSIVEFFDLTIMKDPKFVIIFVGMTLAFAAEVNFVVFFPFVYAEFGYETSRVALFMSTLAMMDLVTRFTVPLLTDKMKLDPKISYSFGLTVLATGRIVLAHADGFKTIMAATLWLGFGKGLRTVFMALVIPSYVPLHRLATASGLQQLANGVVFLTIGPLFGYLRDSTGNYTLLLHCINILTFTAVGLWMLELLITSCRGRYLKKDANAKVEFKPSEEVAKVK